MKSTDKQLGISYSTARYRLMKSILFMLIKESGKDICFRCGKKILNVEDCTIDHKEPWLYADIDLFWDLNNVAFSHGVCNSGATRFTDLRKASLVRAREAKLLANKGPKDTAWCGGCSEYKNTKLFHRNKRNVSGFASYCKTCRKTKDYGDNGDS